MLNVEEPVKNGAVVVAVASAILGGFFAALPYATIRWFLTLSLPIFISYGLLYLLADSFKAKVELSGWPAPFIVLWCFAGILSWIIASQIIRRWTWFRTCLNKSCIGEWWGAEVFSGALVNDQQRYIFHRTIVYTAIFALILMLAMGGVGIESPDILLFWGLCIVFLWIVYCLINLNKWRALRKKWSAALAKLENAHEGKARGLGRDLLWLLSYLIKKLKVRNWTTVLAKPNPEPIAEEDDEEDDGRTRGKATWLGHIFSFLGFWGVIVLAFLFIFQVIRRVWLIPSSEWYLSALYVVLGVLLALYLIWPMVRIRNTQNKRGAAPWLTIGFGMGFLVILLAWGTISFCWWRSEIKDFFGNYQVASQNEGEVRGNESPIAVSLSGGGYRAALIHAGLLAYLEDHNVPVDVLSTVSGGSILGAAIGTGVTPTVFAKALYDNKPGLPYDLMHIWSVVQDVFGSLVEDVFPYSGFTDKYAAHFTRFYGIKKVRQLKNKPLLLVNVTDIQAEPRNARVVLYKGLDGDDDVVANLVAASGAFPGPFQPKTLKWPLDKDNKKKERRFVDGGVVENLGVEGLLKYLSTKPKENWPKILIISDASGHGNPKVFQSQADLVALLTGTLNISFELLHREIYALFTGHPDFLGWLKDSVEKNNELPQVEHTVPYKKLIEGKPEEKGKPEGELITIPIPATSVVMFDVLRKYSSACFYDNKEGETKKKMTAEEIQEKVRDYPTLDELDPEQVRRAFWLGKVLGMTYHKAIYHAIQSAIAAKKSSHSSFDFGSMEKDPKCPPSDIKQADLKRDGHQGP